MLDLHSAEAAEVEVAEGTADSYPSSHMLSVTNAYNTKLFEQFITSAI